MPGGEYFLFRHFPGLSLGSVVLLSVLPTKDMLKIDKEKSGSGKERKEIKILVNYTTTMQVWCSET